MHCEIQVVCWARSYDQFHPLLCQMLGIHVFVLLTMGTVTNDHNDSLMYLHDFHDNLWFFLWLFTTFCGFLRPLRLRDCPHAFNSFFLSTQPFFSLVSYAFLHRLFSFCLEGYSVLIALFVRFGMIGYCFVVANIIIHKENYFNSQHSLRVTVLRWNRQNEI